MYTKRLQKVDGTNLGHRYSFSAAPSVEIAMYRDEARRGFLSVAISRLDNGLRALRKAIT
jgi:hypothetical protein